jgi:hypothetical protein
LLDYLSGLGVSYISLIPASVRHGGSSLASLLRPSLLGLHGAPPELTELLSFHPTLTVSHTNRMRRRSARSAKLNITATIKTRGARAIMLLEEVSNILYLYYLIHCSFIKITSGVYNLVVERCRVNYNGPVLGILWSLFTTFVKPLTP